MPKTNDATGASAAGMQGIVQHGAPINDGRILSELDPELNLDGTLIEGDHPDHADGEERDVAGVATTDPEPQPVDEPVEDEDDAAKRGQDEKTEVRPEPVGKATPADVPASGKFATQSAKTRK